MLAKEFYNLSGLFVPRKVTALGNRYIAVFLEEVLENGIAWHLLPHSEKTTSQDLARFWV